MSNHSLTWGTNDTDAILLTGSSLDGDYWFETLADGGTFGTPQPIEVGLTSLLLDGTRKQRARHDNRAPSFRVVICGPDAAALASGEAALWQMSQTAGTFLTWTPPDVFGAPTAFDVETANVEFQFDDMSELAGRKLERTYLLTWECQPMARSVDLTTMPAVAIDTTLTVIDDCSSATGWTSVESTPVVSSGAVVTTETTSDTFASMTRTGTIDTSGEPYLVFDWETSSPAHFLIVGLENSEVLRTASPFGATWNRSYFFAPTSPTKLDFYSTVLPVGGTLSITQVATTVSLPDSDTGGIQQSLAIAPGGSARTQAQIEVVATGTDALGEVTVYTSPLGQAYNPGMRRWLFSSDAPTANPTGDFQTITGASAYDIPAATIPVGGYMIAARMMCTTTADVRIFWSLQTMVGGVAVGEYVEDGPTISFVANEWRVHPLALETLPTTQVGPAGVIRLGIQRDAASAATVYLHDTFLFHEDGDLTIADCGSGTSAVGGPSRRLRILPPSHDRPSGGLEVAHNTDWSDAYAVGSAAVARPGRGHVLHNRGTSVFVMTPGLGAGAPASVSASWYKRHLAHADD